LRRAATSGDFRILPIAALSLSTIGGGVPTGASMAFQATISNPGTNSEIAGMSGADDERARLEMPSALRVPPRTCGIDVVITSKPTPTVCRPAPRSAGRCRR
jgi:hypothetical protein